LGYTDNVGTTYTDDTVASGYGNHLARPLLRKHWRADLSFDEAKKLLEDCMRVLYYRDARALNRVILFHANFSRFQLLL
jgi:20S proteasome subunit beta 7